MHFVERNRTAVRTGFERSKPERAASVGIAVGMIGESIGIDAVVSRSHLQIRKLRRIPHVAFAIGPPVEFTRVRQNGQAIDGVLRIAERMAAQCFFGQHVEIDALNSAGRAGETTIDDFVAIPTASKI